MEKDLISDIIKKLKKKGCNECDVMAVKSLALSSSQRLGKLEKNERSEYFELGIRAIIGKKQSIISSSNFKSNDLDKLIEKVVLMTKVVPENEFCGLAKDHQITNFDTKEHNKLNLFDKKSPSLKELNKVASTIEENALKNKKIINSEGAEVSWSKTDILLLGSNGLFQQFSRTNSSYVISILAGNKNSMEREFDYKTKVFFSDLGNFDSIGKNTARRAIKKLNSRKIKTCKTNIVFDSRVASSLINNLASAANSSLLVKGTTWLKNKVNKQIFSKGINIIDDPLLPKKLRSKILDFEGIKSKKQFLVEDGNLNFFFNNLDYARELKSIPTGHASRSASSLPSPSPSNLYLENGDITRKDMIKSLKKGLLVTELMGSSININTGDYSRGASGFWVENGEICYPVSEVTIAGNLREIFLNLVPANDLEFNFGTNAPSCLVENMTVAGI